MCNGNVWADLLTCWSSAEPAVRRLAHISVFASSCAKDFQWAFTTKFATVQVQHASTRSEELSLKDGFWMYPGHTIWESNGTSDVQLSLCIITHTGPVGHRGRSATD